MSFEAFLIVSAVLFCIGLYGALARRNVLAVLIFPDDSAIENPRLLHFDRPQRR